MRRKKGENKTIMEMSNVKKLSWGKKRREIIKEWIDSGRI